MAGRTGRYGIFWGCQIPARHPFTEKATRLALPQVGLPFADVEGFSCCPERSLIEVMDEEIWHLAAARNLALAERKVEVLFTPCNGCYGTLKIVCSKLQSDSRVRNRINSQLGKVGLEFTGRLEVRHLVDLLAKEISPARISREIAVPMKGLRIATHPGCHQTRPSLHIGFDHPFEPRFLDDLVAALGASPVQYTTKMLCCGQYLTAVGEAETNESFVRRKLEELRQLEVDALVTTCPACFLQYDTIQSLLERRGESFGVPVFAYQELLALALGHGPEEIGVARHRTNTERFFERWGEASGAGNLVEKHVPLSLVSHCAECGACNNICPVGQASPSFRPNEMIRAVAAGKVEEVLEDGEFWKCVDCHSCFEMCPEFFAMEKVFAALKSIAIERGRSPQGVARAVEQFLAHGRLIGTDDRGRKRLGLGPAPKDGGPGLVELLNEVRAQGG